MSVKGNWRGFHPEDWQRIRALHAQWQIKEPQLEIADTLGRLTRYAILHANEALALAQREEAYAASQ